MKKWLKAFRLRTLPLSLACVGMGSFLAAAYGVFQWPVLVLTVSTTIFLQILSNLANDYGDFLHGADHENREGPSRTVQSGEILPQQMKKAIFIFTILSLLSGCSLLFYSLDLTIWFLVFFVMGLLAIAAAIFYTMGKNPYGYIGLGDFSVLIFFGLIGVCGTYFLHTAYLNTMVLLPAITCGLFAVGVLNVNNIRDINSDLQAGKRSIPVRIGQKNAKIYHVALITGGFICTILFIIWNFISVWQLLFLISLPLFINHLITLMKGKTAKDFDPLLKQLALSTLLFVVLFGIGSILPM